MFLGRVVGTVWATKKEESLQGLKFQIVKKVDEQFTERTFLPSSEIWEEALGDLFGDSDS